LPAWYCRQGGHAGQHIKELIGNLAALIQAQMIADSLAKLAFSAFMSTTVPHYGIHHTAALHAFAGTSAASSVQYPYHSYVDVRGAQRAAQPVTGSPGDNSRGSSIVMSGSFQHKQTKYCPHHSKHSAAYHSKIAKAFLCAVKG
jgi:hypothetical protein